ncbi:MAG TPA: hypothetical protein VN867_14645 [Candidatus Binataceae bacterium]|nr:hypothetical protein [Candidatus Binataceae bacterium]
MLRSVFSVGAILIAFAITAAGCSTHKEKPALPVVTVVTATMNLTAGIEVVARLALPEGFAPSPDYPPLWLQGGKEVAVVGTLQNRTVVIGYGGNGYLTRRIIAEDGGIGAPDGAIVDLAPSPDGMMLALAVVSAKDNRLDVVTRDLISAGAAPPVSSFDGEFETASIAWLSNFTIPLALRARELALETPPDASEITSRLPAAPALSASSGLYTIGIGGAVTTGYTNLNCKMSKLDWSPKGNYAVGAGDLKAPPILIDREKESCERINAKAPLRVLGWSHDSKAFLYQETNLIIGTGLYRYDIATHAVRLVAISSGAAVFVSDDQVLALGNSTLTFRKAQYAPDEPLPTEVALSSADGSATDVQRIGFEVTPATLAASSMTYTHETDSAAIATVSPMPTGPARHIVIYSVASKRAFLVAFGPVRGLATMSWSPQGHYLAIADGDAGKSALTIIVPPR